jgi:hypothetical protein
MVRVSFSCNKTKQGSLIERRTIGQERIFTLRGGPEIHLCTIEVNPQPRQDVRRKESSRHPSRAPRSSKLCIGLTQFAYGGLH